VKNREKLSLDGTVMMENVRSGGRSCGSEKGRSCGSEEVAYRVVALYASLIWIRLLMSHLDHYPTA
jgi:hypothetical protein